MLSPLLKGYIDTVTPRLYETKNAPKGRVFIELTRIIMRKNARHAGDRLRHARPLIHLGTYQVTASRSHPLK